jgi:predicted esterase
MKKMIFLAVFLPLIFTTLAAFQESVAHAQGNQGIKQALSGIKLGTIRDCTSKDRENGYLQVCAMPLDKREIETLKDMEFVDSLAYRIEKDSLILAARVKGSDLSFYELPAFSGEISTFLQVIDSNLFGIKVRFKDISKAKLDLMLINLAGRSPPQLSIDGREPSERVIVEKWSAVRDKLETSGALYQELAFPAAPNFEAKLVYVFKGKNCIKTLTNCNVIYLADGRSMTTFVQNADANNISLDQFVFVGVPSSSQNRVGELLYGRDQVIFDAFMSFVTIELRKFIEKDELPKARYAAGYSNGGVWALDALLLNPDKFNGAIVMSPGSWKTKDSDEVRGKQIFLGAGELEPGFFKQTQIVDKLMLDLGADVKRKYSKSGHSMNTWVPIWLLALNTLNSK